MFKSIIVFVMLIVTVAINSSFIVKKKKKKSTKTTKAARPYYDLNYKLVVDKSDYEMKVYDAQGWLATYPVVFGKNGMNDKKMEGDQATPEGTFRITFKNPNHKWTKFMQFDYPTSESYAKFNARKAKGEIPDNASIGGGVGIHGTWPGSDHVVDNYINWTEGCISMKNTDIEELYELLPMHTKIVIQK
jgi:murein L,D-transpeptidase YafK